METVAKKLRINGPRIQHMRVRASAALGLGHRGFGRRLRSSLAGFGALLFSLLFTAGLHAATNPIEISRICDLAANEAAARTGVPISVLKAISLTETGRTTGGETRPWPWTVNMEGTGVWFDTEFAARAYAYEHYKRGARSFDVGCFQINYKWHHQAFASIEEMFDPVPNALYAARFLLELYEEKGSWEEAAGAFHSRTPEYADRYRARFAAFRAQFEQEDGLPLVMARAPVGNDPAATAGGDTPVLGTTPTRIRVNTYPLLQGGGDTSIGSLVPLGTRGTSGGLFSRGDAG